MSKQKNQGTAWETKTVRDVEELDGWRAIRVASRGIKGEPDVAFTPNHGWVDTIPVLAWKRLTKSAPDAKRRTPDGEPAVAVIGWDDWLGIMEQLENNGHTSGLRFLVQNKATQTLNVTRVLGLLRRVLAKEPY